MIRLKTIIASPQKASEEQMLDTLVQELFLSTLRSELDKQKASHAQALDEALFTLEKARTKSLQNITSEFSTLRENLEGQQQEIGELSGDAQRFYQQVNLSIRESREEVDVLSQRLSQLRQDIARQDERQSERHSGLVQQHQALSEQLSSLHSHATAAARKTHRLLYCGLAGIGLSTVALVGLGLMVWFSR